MDAFVNLTGYVGGEVELRQTRSKVSCASVRVACTPRIRRGGEWTDGETTWITMVCYRVLAENVAVSVSRGDAVILVGRLRTQAWTDADGVDHERLVLEATTVGHDLSRGTAVFQRGERRTATEDDPADIVELASAAERNAAEPLSADLGEFHRVAGAEQRCAQPALDDRELAVHR